MTEPENLTLVFLRRISSDIEEMKRDVHDMRDRMTSLDLSLAGLRRDHAVEAETVARLQSGMDRLRDDIGRIKRRLDLVDETAIV